MSVWNRTLSSFLFPWQRRLLGTEEEDDSLTVIVNHPAFIAATAWYVVVHRPRIRDTVCRELSVAGLGVLYLSKLKWRRFKREFQKLIP